MKTYRSRKLNQRCQIAKTEDGVTPVRDDKGNIILEHSGCWFLKVSGGDNHDRKRLIPEDHDAFFKLKAREVEEALKAEGVTDATVTAEELYAEYVNTFTRPNETYAPQGNPQEFSLVVPKGICVNWVGSVGIGGNLGNRIPNVAPQMTSIFARLKAGRANINGQAPTTPSPFGKKTKQAG